MNRKVTTSAIILLFVVCSTLLATTLHYHALYLNNPRVVTQVTTHEKIINQRYFDPDRTASYTCTPAGATMTCHSPDNTVQVSCTSAGLPVTDYFC